MKKVNDEKIKTYQEIKYGTITLLTLNSSNLDTESREVTTLWSELLEATVTFDINGLEKFVQNVKGNDIIFALQTLERCLTKLKTHGVPDDKYNVPHETLFNSPKVSLARPELSPKNLKESRTLLLLALSPLQFNSISNHLSSADKRLMEAGLITKINDCKSITEIGNLFDKYRHVLAHKRSNFFKRYSTLAENFISAAQKKANEFMFKKVLTQDDFDVLRKGIIFSPQHIQNRFDTSP